MKLISRLFILALAMVMFTGCASMGRKIRDFITGGDSEKPAVRVADATRFSEAENVPVEDDKKYKRMNRQRFEDEADVRAEAGSLWVMEGQGAYLFSQNQTRMVGDLLNVKIEGNPKSQLQTKARVIAKLLDRLENPAVRGPASAGAGDTAAAGAPAPDAGAPAADAAGAKPEGEGDSKNDPIAGVQVVPTRITEQLKDGSYRVRGMQPFMIGKREYKVIVTGIVRPEDFDDAGIAAPKLLDPQFDIVSSKKGATL